MQATSSGVNGQDLFSPLGPNPSILPHSHHTFDLSRGRGGNILGSEKSSLTNLLPASLLPFIWAGEGSDALRVAKLVPTS